MDRNQLTVFSLTCGTGTKRPLAFYYDSPYRLAVGFEGRFGQSWSFKVHNLSGPLGVATFHLVCEDRNSSSPTHVINLGSSGPIHLSKGEDHKGVLLKCVGKKDKILGVDHGIRFKGEQMFLAQGMEKVSNISIQIGFLKNVHFPPDEMQFQFRYYCARKLKPGE